MRQIQAVGLDKNMDSFPVIICTKDKAGYMGTDVGEWVDVYLGAWKFYSYYFSICTDVGNTDIK